MYKYIKHLSCDGKLKKYGPTKEKHQFFRKAFTDQDSR